MKTLVSISISLWLLISLTLACRSTETKPADVPSQPDSVQVIEQPKPAGEQQTDSLKRMLDEKRQQRKP